jgi:hypothetical protein
VETKKFDGGGSIFDFDTGIDIGANDEYLNLFDMPASVDLATFSPTNLSLDDIAKMSADQLSQAILKKDEKLLKKGAFIKEMVNREEKAMPAVKDGNGGLTQDSIVNAIFGNNNIRRDGEKTVERTITITIKDTVLD